MGKEFSPGLRNPLLLLLFYLLLILFPANLAKRFLLPQGYVLGLLSDYLVPALYLTEVVVFFLLLLTPWKKVRRRNLLGLILLFLLSLLPSVFKGGLSIISVVRFLELSLWSFFALWIAENISWRGRKRLFLLLGLGVSWVSLLALAQFCQQSSIFGYWFLGEPVLRPSLGGVAKTSLFGVEVLRSYGTFPHPNVLGGVLSVLLVWFLAVKSRFPFLIGLGGLLVSLSRTAWVSFLGGGIVALLSSKGLSLLAFLPERFLSDLSVTRRWELLQAAWEMLKTQPWTGMGLGQFTAHLPQFGLPSGLTLFIQPVHNIFALVGAESGIFALIAFILLLAFALRKTLRERRFLLTIALVQLIFLGFFDHYLYTLPQGLFLWSLILGLSFSYSET